LLNTGVREHPGAAREVDKTFDGVGVARIGEREEPMRSMKEMGVASEGKYRYICMI